MHRICAKAGVHPTCASPGSTYDQHVSPASLPRNRTVVAGTSHIPKAGITVAAFARRVMDSRTAATWIAWADSPANPCPSSI